MKTMLYLYDNCGNYTGSIEHVRYAPIPGNCTLDVPPDGQYPVWNGSSWDLKDEPVIPPPVSPVVPQSITPRQCRLELLNRGLLDQVETMIAEQDQATRITWEYAVSFERNNPLLLALANNIGLSEFEIDEFFIEASKL